MTRRGLPPDAQVAIKMALQYWRARGIQGRTKLLTVRGGYHGDTFGAMAVCDPVNGMHAEMFSGVLAPHLFAPKPPRRFGEACGAHDLLEFEQMLSSRADEVQPRSRARSARAPEALPVVACRGSRPRAAATSPHYLPSLSSGEETADGVKPPMSGPLSRPPEVGLPAAAPDRRRDPRADRPGRRWDAHVLAGLPAPSAHALRRSRCLA